MNTYKTPRGIEFELEVIEVGYKDLKVQATCEEGSNTFVIDFFYPIKEDDAFYAELLDGNTSMLTDEELEEVMSWVDEVTISFIASEASKICTQKSNSSEYWSFNLYCYECVKLDVFRMEVLPVGFDLMESFSAYGEEEIKELIYKLKK